MVRALLNFCTVESPAGFFFWVANSDCPEGEGPLYACNWLTDSE